MKTLRECSESGLHRFYFSSNVPFYNGGIDFTLYRVAKEEDFAKHEISGNPLFRDGFFVVPARYDPGTGRFTELVPVEVFRNQHLDDFLFLQCTREET